MKLIQIVFSPTGGTQKVMDALSAAFDLPTETIDLCLPEAPKAAIAGDDIALIAVPSYFGRVPALAAERLSRLQGNGAACALVCVYGNRAYEDTFVEMQDLAAACGFRACAAVAAVAEHSIMHQYAAGRPDPQDVQELQRFARQIAEKLRAGGEALGSNVLPGNRPYKKAGGHALVPKAGKDCTACGVCAASCPAQAIDKDSPKTADAKKCISCMRCIAVCPAGARSANPALVAASALALKKACSGHKPNELFL